PLRRGPARARKAPASSSEQHVHPAGLSSMGERPFSCLPASALAALGRCGLLRGAAKNFFRAGHRLKPFAGFPCITRRNRRQGRALEGGLGLTVAADRDIVRLCQQGRPEGFALLLEEYQGKVYRRAYSFLRHREDALDVTQEVFLRAARAIGHFQSDRPLWPWLRQVTTRACLNYIRDHRQRPPTVSLDDVQAQGEPAAAEGDPEQHTLLAWEIG